MTHWKKLTNPNYIGSYSLDDGKDLTVTIERVNQEKVKGTDGTDEDCIVAYIKGYKPMILNKTNCKAIEQLHGTPMIEEWAGKQITLFIAKVSAFGSTVDALRIRPVVAEVKKEDLNPKHPKWDGAKKAIESGSTTIERIKKTYTLTKKNEEELCKISK